MGKEHYCKDAIGYFYHVGFVQISNQYWYLCQIQKGKTPEGENPRRGKHLRDILLCVVTKPSLFLVKIFDECFKILVDIKVQLVEFQMFSTAKTLNRQFPIFTATFVHFI